ncbi:variable large family protein (plasmid) [Borrelia coriaceae]|uniref:Variable large protein n=1 Tax=Borrelia coriaceae ATCC 43381 TaxID=1408429 RepID=W5SW90_9SPIR|nr:variable large family protein [Borrelia coriaceae]AHH11454.1 Variable outer membrane protein [Borrelia coriaceae ATCC 43381]UPA17285.1 variable large family protein [Borrelia coriaceae]
MKINIENISLKSICAILFISLFLSCNNSGEESLADKGVGKGLNDIIADSRKVFLDAFLSFGDLLKDTFGITATTTKSDIGGYFNKISETMKMVQEKLTSEIVEKAHYSKVKDEVNEFIGKLTKIEEGAKKAVKGATDSEVIGGVVKADAAGDSPSVESVKNLVEGIKGIVDGLVLKEGNAQTDKTDPAGTDKEDIGRLFGAQTSANQGAEAKHTAAASASIGAVSGADILKAIADVKFDAKKNGKVNEANDAAALALAKGTGSGGDEKLGAAKKDAIIAAGIALRAMANKGKFIVKEADAKKTEAEGAKGVASSAVNKTLSTLIIAIRNAVDTGLNKINEVLAMVKQEDKFIEATTSGQ